MTSVSSLPRRASFVGSRAEWFALGPTLWVAISSGLHGGRVETDGALFFAVDDVNAALGRFASLREAMNAVESGVHSPAAA